MGYFFMQLSYFFTGSFFVLTGKFQFKRLMGFAVLQIYVPSIAIVAVSWISLWIRRNATPARVGKKFTSFIFFPISITLKSRGNTDLAV